MALYHFHVGQVKRSEGRTAVASAAYRAGEKLYNRWDGMTHDYTRKGGVVLSEILLPEHAPERFLNRSVLWNELEQIEKRADAQLAYSFDLALQNEFSLEENIALARQFVQEQFIADGMIVDLAVHLPDKGNGGIPNPHFHVLAPIRPLNPDGTWGAKQRREYRLDENGQRIKNKNGNWVFDAVPTTDWGKPETLDRWRKEWADLVNVKFAEKGLDCRIDHRSYQAQGQELLPTVHEGPQVRKMEQKGIRTEKGELNRWIRATNRMMQGLLAMISALKETLREIGELADDSQDIMLVDLLQDALAMRNAAAAAYVRGTQKAKVGNLKRAAEEVEYLKSQNILTLQELEQKVDSLERYMSSSKDQMKSRQMRMKELRMLLDLAAEYKTLKPVADELKQSKYRFRKAKEKYQADHKTELNRFYMVRRKLRDAGFEKAPFPVKSWEAELQTVSAEYAEQYERYRPIREELNVLYRIRGDIDSVLRSREKNDPEVKKKEPER